MNHAASSSPATVRSLRRLSLVTAAWCGLLVWVVAAGRSAHGVPAALGEFHYAFQIVFLPAIVVAQLALGASLLRRGGISEPARHAADALALPAAVVVGTDLVLMGVGRPGALGPLPQAVAALLALGILRRATGRWKLAFAVLLGQALPALLFVR